MKSFTFFKIRRGRTVNDFDIEFFENVDTARAHAEAMIRRNGYDEVEIWDGCESVNVAKPVPFEGRPT